MFQRGLRYDDANMRQQALKKRGISSAAWKNVQTRLITAKNAVAEIERTASQGFFHLPFNTRAQKTTSELAKHVSRKFTDLVVLGIGGSDVGARAIQQALIHPTVTYKGMRVYFAGSTTDPDDLAKLLLNMDLKKTCINIISKSGDTIEPMSAFYVLKEKLIRAVGSASYSSHIVATTDPVSGTLRALSAKEGYALLDIPRNVEGRYSVLTPVGLFPAAAMGVDTAKLLKGAASALQEMHRCRTATCVACRFAGLQAWSASQGRSVQVIMPYSSRLSEFARWARQLIGESLGKKRNRQGKVVHAGITPMACVGPEDQHSQLQLWAEGPADKTITFIEIAKRAQDFRSPYGSLQKALHLERWATAEALRLESRPNGTMVIDQLDAYSLGALFMTFELSAALMGELMDVNAYNQPGVALMKKLLVEKLS
jgi:glucose-6-phosphate isomerase